MAEKEIRFPRFFETVEFESIKSQCQEKMEQNAELEAAQDNKLSELEAKVSESVEADTAQDEKMVVLEEKIKELEEKLAECVKSDAEQSEKMTAFEEKLNELEEKVAVSETKEMISNIANMKEGEELSVSFAANVSLNDTLTIKKNTIVNLDLNEKELVAVKPNVDAIIAEEGSTLVVDGNGYVEAANGGNGYPLIANGKVIVNSGHFKSNRDAENLANACVYARGNGQIEIYGGRFETADGTFVLNKKDADRATTSIKVFGGEFVNFDPSDNASEIPHENFVADGYKVESYQEGENTIYKVVKE